MTCSAFKLPVFLAFSVSCAISANAQVSPALDPAPAQAASVARVVIETADGALSSRALEGLEVESLAQIPAAFVRFDGLAPPVSAAGTSRELAELRLTGGDWLTARVVGGDGDVLSLELPHAQRFEVDVDHLISLLFSARVPLAQRGVLQAPENGDRLLWARPGGIDRVDGTLEAFGDEGIEFESVLGSRAFPWGEIAALYIEPVGESPPKQPANRARRVAVDLAAGGRLRGELRKLDARSVELSDVAGRDLTLPLGAVAEIAIDDGSMQFLSELAPARAIEGWPADDNLGLRWRYQVDRAVSGGALRADGVAWRRGIGVHAPSRLEWDLDGAWRTLRGSVAVDDSVLLLAARGSVQFSVFLGDSKEPAWTSGLMRGGDAPLELPKLDLRGVRKLALDVSMETELYVADRANWLRVVLVR